MTGRIETRQRATAFMGNVIAMLGLLALGHPLAPAAIRSMLLGWVLFVVATTQFIWMHFRPTGYSVALSPARMRPRDYGRYQVPQTYNNVA